MNMSEIIGGALGVTVISLIFALIFSAIVHFVFADGIWQVMFLYLIVAFVPSILALTSVSRSSAIVGSIIAIIIIFLIMNYIFPILFGPNIAFPYSILNLGPVITGVILSVIITGFSSALRG